MKSIHVKIRPLQVFVAVIKLQSYTSAAEVIGVTQSAISHAIKTLEIDLGSPILSRTRGHITPTPLGIELLKESKTILMAAERISSLGARSTIKGYIRLGLVASVTAKFGAHSLALLNNMIPNIRVEILEGTDQEIARWIKEGTIDIGVGNIVSGEIFELLIDDPLMLVSPKKGYKLEIEASIAVLNNSRFIMSESGCEPMLTEIFRSHNVSPSIVMRVRDISALIAMVRAGHGVTIIPKLAVPNHGLHDLQISEIIPKTNRSLYLLATKNTPNDILEVFKEVMKMTAMHKGYYPSTATPKMTIRAPNIAKVA